jgi:hypothetical protein
VLTIGGESYRLKDKRCGSLLQKTAAATKTQKD